MGPVACDVPDGCCARRCKANVDEGFGTLRRRRPFGWNLYGTRGPGCTTCGGYPLRMRALGPRFWLAARRFPITRPVGLVFANSSIAAASLQQPFRTYQIGRAHV